MQLDAPTAAFACGIFTAMEVSCAAVASPTLLSCLVHCSSHLECCYPFRAVKTVIHNEPAKRGSGPCSVLKWCTEGGKINLFTGFSTGKVASFTLEAGALRKRSALSFGVAVSSPRLVAFTSYRCLLLLSHSVLAAATSRR